MPGSAMDVVRNKPVRLSLPRATSKLASGLRVIGKGLTLLLRSPAWLLRANSAFRGFQDDFVHAAVAEGLPEDLALHLASQVKPREMVKSFQGITKL